MLFRSTGALLAGALIGALALTGCGAGQIAQTAYQVDNAGGAFARSGPIEVLNAKIALATQTQGDAAYAAGTSAPISMRITNTGDTPDLLQGARSPVAASVQIIGAQQVQPGVPLVVESTPTTVATAPTPAGQPGASQAQILLTGLTEDIRPGLDYPLVLVFERAGEVQLNVPVEVPAQPRA